MSQAPPTPSTAGGPPLDTRSSFRGDAKHRTTMCNCTSENLEIPRCTIVHLRSGAHAPSRNDGAKTLDFSRFGFAMRRKARNDKVDHLVDCRSRLMLGLRNDLRMEEPDHPRAGAHCRERHVGL